MATEADYRLPRQVIPSHYRLEFRPDIDGGVFTGRAAVDIDVSERVGDVVVNAVDLDIRSWRVDADHGSVTGSVSYDGVAERATLSLDHPLEPGKATLYLDFAGELNDGLAGFYRAGYTDDEGVERAMAVTQFEATDARMAFPCWDEPDLKASFGITLVVPEDLFAISNAAVVARDPVAPGKVAVRFADTPVMSTYLVAMVVGDLESSEVVDGGGVPLRVFSVPGKGHLTDLALEIGRFSLEFLTDYFGIPYPGDKLDLIAVPAFASGAMENLGCVTFRESDLLIDPDRATQAELARVVDVVAHELAHMWFGDLVTMRWWDGIWLNEAFATFMEQKVVDGFRPDWKPWLNFATPRARAMDVDGLAETRSIQAPVASPEEARAMFDVLTYRKGAAILRMLEVFLGEETFRRGISRYLEEHSFGNTDTADLWQALEAESDRPVGEIMSGWVDQGGFPLITVSRVGDGYRLSQSAFRFEGESNLRWKIPALYRSGSKVDTVLLEDPVTVEGDGGFFLNHRGQGFYRVHYQDVPLPDLQSLEAEERFTVLSDAAAAMLAGRVTGSEYVRLTEHLGGESEPDVWNMAIGGLVELDRVLDGTERENLQARTAALVRPALARLGWEPEPGEPDLRRRLRGVLIEALGKLGEDAATIATAREVSAAWMEGGDIDGDVGAAALQVAAGHGTEDDFDLLLGKWRAAETPQAKVRYLRAAAAVPGTEHASRLLDMIIDAVIPKQEAAWMAALLLGHRDNGEAIWQRMKPRWSDLLAAPPDSNKEIIIALVHFRSRPEIAADIADWLNDHPIHGADRYTAQQLERLRIRVALRGRESGSFRAGA